MHNAIPNLGDREMDRLREVIRRRNHAPATGSNAAASRPACSPADSGDLAPLDVPPSDYLALERHIAALQLREQQARAEAREDRDAHRAKDRFLAILSHELRTPLQPVLAAAAVLLRDARLPADLLEDVRTIQRNVQLEARLIDDLFDLTRITSGKLSLEVDRINLHSVIARAVEICEPDAMEKRLVLSTRLHAKQSWVHGDPGRLQQVMWNLIKNAVKFTPAGGEITITTADGPGGTVVVQVIDTGVGIPPEKLPTIFEPFEQGGGEITRRFGGLGLGLAISRLLVDAHSGTLAAQSDGTGLGTTMSVTLTAVDPPATHKTHGRGHYAGQPTRRLLRILLVEDDEATAFVMAKLLKTTGHTVETAADCATARAAAASGEFDLLLCDLGLPDGSGLDLVGPVKQSGAPCAMKAIALKGYGSEEDVTKSRRAGFDAHLTKPITLDQLVQQINRLFP